MSDKLTSDYGTGLLPKGATALHLLRWSHGIELLKTADPLVAKLSEPAPRDWYAQPSAEKMGARG